MILITTENINEPISHAFAKIKKEDVTLICSYYLSAQVLASLVTLIDSFNSSILRILDLSPPNILDEAASSFSILAWKAATSDERV